MTNTSKKRVAILGAGMTGLSAAKHLKEKGFDVIVLEKENHIGGLAKDCSKNGYIVDLGPHYVFETLAKKTGLKESDVSRFPYYEELFQKGKFYSFPFGMMKNIRFAASVGWAYLSKPFKSKEVSTLQDCLLLNYGKTFTNEILSPLLSKWSGADPKIMSLTLAKRLEPANLDQILFFVKKVVFKVSPDYVDRSRHWVYPHLGIKHLFDKVSEGLVENIHLNEQVEKIIVQDGKVSRIQTSKQSYHVDFVVSTLPINKLHSICEGSDLLEPYSKLRFRAVRFFFIRYPKEKIMTKLWTWFPHKDFMFYRISEPKNVLDNLGPKNETQLTVEVACEVGDDIWSAKSEDLLKIIDQQIRASWKLGDMKMIDWFEEKAPYVYPIFLKDQDAVRDTINYQTPFENMYWGGRPGQFKYIFLEECFGIGKKCAEKIQAASV